MGEGKHANRKRRSCPACRERALVPIFYGPLPDSLAEDRARGDLHWGGLVKKRDSPRWRCLACESSFPATAVH